MGSYRTILLGVFSVGSIQLSFMQRYTVVAGDKHLSMRQGWRDTRLFGQGSFAIRRKPVTKANRTGAVPEFLWVGMGVVFRQV
jgi:hypothetical protein